MESGGLVIGAAAPSIAEARLTGLLDTAGDGIVVIDDQDLAHLFTASGSSSAADGGLGLAMSKAIAQNHGGDLTVDPGGRGRGACFTLHLPIPQARA
jgi:two-component system sensor kinase FixL